MNIILMTSAAPETAPFSTKEKRPPMGLGFLISVLRNAGHRVFFFDPYLNPDDTPDDKFIINHAIDYVGIYANTICYSNTMEIFHQLQSLREKGLWHGKIMVGGPHTSVGVETIPGFVDHVMIGEGEISILNVVSGNEKKRVLIGERVKDLDTLPLPAWDEFIHRPYQWRDIYVEKWPVYTLNTSRGCPFKCVFCSTQTIWGRGYRCMSAERVLHDVEYLMKYYGMKVAYFREDHFTLNMKRVRAYCEGVLSRNLPIDWMCESRADVLLSEDDVALMARAGCKWLYIGVESGSPRMLERMNKGETVEDFIRAFDLAHRYGIKTYASFVVGMPGETHKDIQLTYDLIDKIKPNFHCMNVYVGLPGSPLYEEVIANNLYEYIDPWGMAYLKGHDQRVDLYYGGSPAFKIPQDPSEEKNHPHKRCSTNTASSESSSMHPKAAHLYKQVNDLNLPLNEKHFITALNQPREAALMEAYMRLCLKSLFDSSPDMQVGLYGAGKHTTWLLGLMNEMKLPQARIVIDDRCSKSEFAGIPQCSPHDIRPGQLTDIIISSDARHYHMHSKLLNHPLFQGIKIHDFYEYLPWAPYSKARSQAQLHKPTQNKSHPPTTQAELYDRRYAHGYRLQPKSYDLARSKALVHFITKILKVHDATSVMDYGSGNGLFLPMLEHTFRQADIHCCDISKTALDQITKQFPAYEDRCHLVQNNRADISSDFFDVVISIETMEHVEDLNAYLMDMHRLLRPGGTLIWTTPCANKGSIEQLYAKATGQIEQTDNGSRRWRFEDETHVRRLKTSEIESILLQMGFDQIVFRMRSHLFSFLHVRSKERSWIHRHPEIIEWDYNLFRCLPNGASMIGGAVKQ